MVGPDHKDVRRLGKREGETAGREVRRQCVGKVKYHLGYQKSAAIMVFSEGSSLI